MTEINLTPNFDRLRMVFERDAKLKADNFAHRLSPPCNDTTLEQWHEQKADTLRAVHELLVPLAIAAQCSTKLEDILVLRELLEHAMVKVRVQAEALELQIAEANDARELGVPTFRTADGFTLYFDTEDDVWTDSLSPGNADMTFGYDGISDDKRWPIDFNGEHLAGEFIAEGK